MKYFKFFPIAKLKKIRYTYLMNMIDTIIMSSERQITLPGSLKIDIPLAGMQFMLYADGENILLKSVTKSSVTEFKQQMRLCQELAATAGLSEADIAESIKSVRTQRKYAHSN
ncbi:hypothetical protein FACS1894109_16150 [Spirochaetia bacterium]|nr:hypothetical protein FACS1894109_16150 [Spirochaetia bacterium]